MRTKTSILVEDGSHTLRHPNLRKDDSESLDSINLCPKSMLNFKKYTYLFTYLVALGLC